MIPPSKDLKAIFLHNFSNEEISLILSVVKKLYSKEDRKKLVFARTTEHSLKMEVQEWIEDTAEDHLYLLQNPPTAQEKNAHISTHTSPSKDIQDNGI